MNELEYDQNRQLTPSAQGESTARANLRQTGNFYRSAWRLKFEKTGFFDNRYSLFPGFNPKDLVYF